MKVFRPNLLYPWGRLGQGSGTLGHHPFVLEMLYIDNFCTGSMILWGYSVHYNTIYIVYLRNLIFVGFQKITFVC